MQIGRGGGQGTVTVNGASAILNVGNELHIGEDGGGANSMTVSAGTVNVNSWVTVSRGTTQGTLTISGTGVLNQGLTDAGSRLEITNPGGTGTGRVNLDGGTLSTNGIVTSGDAASTSIFNFNGGTLKPLAANGGFMGVGRANVRDGGAKIDTNGFDITIGQALLHSDIVGDHATDGGLTKNGAGTLTLTAQNTFNGGVTINQGTVATSGGGQMGRLGQGPTTVNAGAVLQSNGGDSFGFLGGSPSVINVVGGTITSASGAFRTTLPNLNMTGGTLTSAGNTGDASGVYSFNAGTTVTTNAAATSALFNAAQVGMQNVVTFAVADGAAAADLQVSSVLSNVTYGGNAGGINKTGAGKMVLAANNSYTGPTNVAGGTLEISGSLNGASQVSVTSGTLLLSGNNAVNTATPLTLGAAGPNTSGTVKFADTGISDVSATFGTLTLSFDSTLDFGSAGGGQEFRFAGLTPGHVPISGPNLSILNWDGTANVQGNSTTDRLIFTTGSASDFTSVFGQADVSFNGLVGYQAIDFGGNTGYEIVAIPEPSSSALLGSLALLGLIGYREGRRLWGRVRTRKSSAMA